MRNTPHQLDDLDRKIIAASQNGLPLVPEPYEAVAQEVDAPSEEVSYAPTLDARSGHNSPHRRCTQSLRNGHQCQRHVGMGCT